MARFLISAKNAPTVRIEYTDDISDKIKPKLIDLFGINFLSSIPDRKQDLSIHIFEATEESIDELVAMLTKWKSEIIADIDIDLNLN